MEPSLVDAEVQPFNNIGKKRPISARQNVDKFQQAQEHKRLLGKQKQQPRADRPPSGSTNNVTKKSMSSTSVITKLSGTRHGSKQTRYIYGTSSKQIEMVVRPANEEDDERI